MSKNQQISQNLTLVEWCDQQVANGHDIQIKWDGGGDSGWVYFEIDNQQVDNEYTERIIRFMDEHLDYGSWAGEFQASGQASYNPETKSFEGTDYYSEDESISWELNYEIRIPKRIWFDDLLFSAEGDEYSPSVDFRFFIKNGFLTPEHDEIIKKLDEEGSEAIDGAIEQFEKEYKFRGVWDNTTISRADFREEGDDLVYVITHIDLGTYHGHDKDVVLDVTDVDEQIKESEES